MAMTDEALRLYRDAEQSVLGALIADAPANAADVFRQVKAEYFITGDYKHIFETCRKMFAHNDQIDPITVRSACGTEYIELVKQLCDLMMTPSHCSAYIRQLRDCAIRYRLDTLMRKAQGHVAYSSPLPEIAATVDQMQSVLAYGSEDDGSDMNELLLDYFEDWPNTPDFLDWGFPSLNHALMTQLGQYVVLAAEPSAGKTAFALSAATALAKKHRVTFYTLEMDKQRLMQRIMARTAFVPLNKIKAHRCDAAEMEAQVRAKAKLLNLPFRIVRASNKTVDQIAADVKNTHTEVAIIDYLQLIPPPGPRMTEYDTITANTKALQQLAQLDICVIALSQLSNEGNLRGSGQIKQDADVVLRLGIPNKDKLKTPEQFRALEEDRLRILKIEKNRDGRRMTLPFWFEGQYQRFIEQWEGFDESRVVQMEEDPYKQQEIETA